jgi:hypothetical protein
MNNDPKEKFFKEYLLNPRDLENLEDATGISPERAVEIYNITMKSGMKDSPDPNQKNYIQAIYDLGIDPEDEDERKKWPDIYFGLTPIEKVFAGYLLGWEQASEAFISKLKEQEKIKTIKEE